MGSGNFTSSPSLLSASSGDCDSAMSLTVVLSFCSDDRVPAAGEAPVERGRPQPGPDGGHLPPMAPADGEFAQLDARPAVGRHGSSTDLNE